MDRINKLFRALAAVVEEMQPLASVVCTFGTEAYSMISTSTVVRGRAWAASCSRFLSLKLRCSLALFRHRGSWMICHPLASRHRFVELGRMFNCRRSISTLFFFSSVGVATDRLYCCLGELTGLVYFHL